MSIGNLACAIGLANTSKIPHIGDYVQGTPFPGPGATGPYIGCSGSNNMNINGICYFDTNVLGEDYTAVGGITVTSDSGVAAGKVARWVSNTSSLSVAADGLCSVSVGGVVTAQASSGLYKCYFTAATVVPANSFFWVFLV